MTRIPTAFSCSPELLKLLDDRAGSLGMKRSEYIVQLIRQDLATGRPNLSIVAETATVNGDIIQSHKKPLRYSMRRKRRRP